MVGLVLIWKSAKRAFSAAASELLKQVQWVKNDSIGEVEKVGLKIL